MHLGWLELRDFRSYESLQFEPDTGLNVLVGDNGAGKTNVLEAVGYLSRLGSFRGAPDAALVRTGAPAAVVRGGIERELAVKGFVRATEGEPDFLLEYAGGVADQFRVAGGTSGVAPGYSWGDTWGEEASVSSYGEGHLLLDVMDPESKKVLWSAWARRKARTPEQFRSRIDRGVKKLLKGFPSR